MTPGSGKIYRLRRTYLRQGIGCAIAFLFFGVGSSLASYYNIDGSFAEPELGALIFGVLWSGPLLLAFWIIAAYYRERLELAGTIIVQQHVFQTLQLEHDEVRQIRWGTLLARSGGIVVKAASAQITIYLVNYTIDEREEITQYLRTNFAEAVHENWPEYAELIERNNAPSKPVSPTALWLLIALLLAFTVANMIAWWYGLGAQFLVVSVINVSVLLYCRRRQRTAQQEPPPSEVA